MITVLVKGVLSSNLPSFINLKIELITLGDDVYWRVRCGVWGMCASECMLFLNYILMEIIEEGEQGIYKVNTHYQNKLIESES